MNTHLIALVLLVLSASDSAARSLSWEEAFNTSVAPDNVYFEAIYQENGLPHRIKVWRQGEIQVRRETDGQIDLYALRQPDGEVQYRIFDLSQRRSIRITRNNLYRIGVFRDWLSLGHVLSKPWGEYAIYEQGGRRALSKGGSCLWYELYNPQGTQICWSKEWGLPLLIKDSGENGAANFEILAVRKFSPNAEPIHVPDNDFITIDANLEIDPSED